MSECCLAMEKVLKEYDSPFHYPLRINMETHNITAKDLAIALRKLTPSGKISRKAESRAWAIVNFCPFCGKRLQEQAEVSDDE